VSEESKPSEESNEIPQHFWVNGIVANRDKRPYVQLSNENGLLMQVTMAEARQIARDIMVAASRAEADAMILKFFSQAEFPDNAAAALMMQFRDFRGELDDEAVEHGHRGEVEEL
jgi:hypothetical protein